MNIYKIFSIVMLLAMVTPSIQAQNSRGKTNDYGRIVLSAYVPSQVEGIPASARNLLKNKLNRLVTKNGMGGSTYSSRFIITPNISVLTKDLLATAPPMTALTLDVSLYIGDGLDGKLFSSESVVVKGVGRNENKAYINALKNIRANNPSIQGLIEEGKNRIIEYYNDRCDYIITEAKTLESQNKYREAIFRLTTVPEVSKECYTKSMEAVAPIYKKQIDRECQMKLQKAQGVWSANQDMNSANIAGAILASIEPDAACYGQVKSLSSRIHTRVREIDEREWKYILTDQKQKSEWIQAVRAVGVAYGRNQPKSVTYNTRGWW